MATCKDCLNADVCYMVEHYGVDIEEDRQEYDCHQFKAKTNYVEVTRCKDCKYYNQLEKGCDWHGYYYHVRVEPDGFCSYGERRTDG